MSPVEELATIYEAALRGLLRGMPEETWTMKREDFTYDTSEQIKFKVNPNSTITFRIERS